MYKFLDKIWQWNYPLFILSSLVFAVLAHTTNEKIVPLFLIFWLVYGMVSCSRIPNSSFKTSILIFVIYVVLSIIQYLFNGVPFVAYYFDFRSVLCPMVFVFVGMANSDSRIYKLFVLSSVFMVAVGIILYFWQPGWYLTFRSNVYSSAWFMADSNVSEDNVMYNSLTSRFASFMGNAYPIAYYSIFSLCILFCDVYKSKQFRIFNSSVLQICMIAILVAGIMMTLTRVAILYLFAMIFYFFVYGIIHHKENRFFFQWIVVILFASIIFIFVKLANTDYGSFIIENIVGRFDEMNFSSAMEGSRTDQTKSVIESWNNIIFGEGMGSRGGAVRPLGLPGITDGNWVRWLVEYGLFGMTLFLIPLIRTLWRAFKYRSYYMIEFLIIVYTILSMVVADSLSKGHMILIFWYAMGRVWNIGYEQHLKQNNIKI